MEPAAATNRDELAWMEHALREAAYALEHDDVPVGAVVVHMSTGEIIARAHNCRERDADPTAHAELLALRAAARHAGKWRLTDYALVVTLEPCPMCAGAAWAARIARLVFGAADPKAGAAGSVFNLLESGSLNHRAQVTGGVLAGDCGQALKTFFQARR